MKFKSVYIFIVAIAVSTVFFMWKLNSFYLQEKEAALSVQKHQQSLALKTSISAQLNQLKNTLSSYTGSIEESQINWVQLNSFFALGKANVNANGSYTVKSLFSKSGTAADKWDQVYVQKALMLSRYSGSPLHMQMFENNRTEKFLVLIFSDSGQMGAAKTKNSEVTFLVGEPFYFQKFFDSVRSSQISHVYLTQDKIVLAHSESQYVGKKFGKQLSSLSKKEAVGLEESGIRLTNTQLVSFTHPSAVSGWVVPYFVMAVVLGMSFILMGLSLYLSQTAQKRKSENALLETALKEEISIEAESQEGLSKDDNAIVVLDEVTDEQADLLADGFKLVPINTDTKVVSENATEEVLLASDETSEFSSNDETTEDVVSLTQVSIKDDDSADLPDDKPSIHFDPPVERVSLMEVVKKEPVYETLENLLKKSVESMNTQIRFKWVGAVKNKEWYDEERISKAMANIVSNAEDAGATMMSIEFDYNDKGLNVRFVDNGRGYDEKNESLLFDPYFTTKDRKAHRGLGLAEIKSIFEKYKGKVSISKNSPEVKYDLKNTNTSGPALDFLGGTTVTVFFKDEGLDIQNSVRVEIDDILDLELQLDEYAKELENEVKKIEISPEPKKTVVNKSPRINFQAQEKDLDKLDIVIRKPNVTNSGEVENN